MALEAASFAIPALDADADLSSNQFQIVKMSATDKRVSLASVDGEVFLGVLQNKPNAAGKSATVVGLGVTKVIAGEALVAGDLWGTDTAGKARKVEATNTGADTGDYVGGQVLIGVAAADEVATVTIGFPTLKVESV